MTLEEQLYIALRSSPCRCTYTWRKPDAGNQGDRERTHHCSRCRALERYEQEKGIERSTE